MQPTHTMHNFAALVENLRQVQKKGGLGYKTPTDCAAASALEKQVDQAIVEIKQQWWPLAPKPDRK